MGRAPYVPGMNNTVTYLTYLMNGPGIVHVDEADAASTATADARGDLPLRGYDKLSTPAPPLPMLSSTLNTTMRPRFGSTSMPIMQ